MSNASLREKIYPYEYQTDHKELLALIDLYKANKFEQLTIEGQAIVARVKIIEEGYSSEEICILRRLINESLFQSGRNTECLSNIEDSILTGILPVGDPHCMIMKGWVYAKSGEYERSLQIAIEMLKNEEFRKDTIYCGQALFLRGRSEYFLGRTVSARRNLSDAIALFRISNAEFSQGAALNALGNLEKATCSLVRAVPIWEKSLALFQRIQCGQKIFSVIINLCVAYLKMGLPEKSQEYLNMEYPIVNSQQRVHKAVMEARISCFTGQYDEALDMLFPVIEVATSDHLFRDECIILESIGDAYAEKQEYSKAKLYYERAYQIALSLPARGELVVGLELRKANLFAAEEEYLEAIKVYRVALKLAQDCNEKYEEAAISRGLGVAYGEMRQYRKAYASMQRAASNFNDQGAKYYYFYVKYEMALLRYKWAIEVREIQRADPVAAVKVNEHDLEFLGDNDSNHIHTAWSHVIESFHGFADLDRKREQALCEKLMEDLRAIGSPLWVTSDSGSSFARSTVKEGAFVASAPSMQRLLTMVDIASKTSEPVLIIGETGTGKEVIAKIIHDNSDNSRRSFVPVNCAAIPEALFESEFFGHKKGSFTGALFDKVGLCEESDGGTLFLDEIGDMPIMLQAKLLRLLQEGTFRRVGDPQEKKVNLRVIAATNANICQLIKGGGFRPDLYYRLQTLELIVPPLRERVEDIEQLMKLFIGKISNEELGLEQIFEDDVIVTLKRYPWPGNVRELEAITRRLALLSQYSGRSSVDMLPREIAQWKDAGMVVKGGLNLARYLDKAEKERIQQALIIVGGHRSEAAGLLGISRNALYRKMDRLNLKLPT